MPRNAEVIRQWTILREIERSRAAGVTIDELAGQCAVTTRTIRRDLQALEEAGFPIYDDRSRDDGRTRWIINGQAFKGLAAGLTLSELCALYFSRSLVESLSGTPFRDEVDRAFEKLTAALTPHMQRFLDQLPRVLSAKTQPQSAARRLEAIARRSARARGDAAPAPGHHHLFLEVERSHEDLPRPSLSPRLRAGRALHAGLRAGIPRGADLRRRSDFGAVAAGGNVHPDRGAPGRGVSALAGRAFGPARARASSNFSRPRPSTSGRAPGTRRSKCARPTAAASR